MIAVFFLKKGEIKLSLFRLILMNKQLYGFGFMMAWHSG